MRRATKRPTLYELHRASTNAMQAYGKLPDWWGDGIVKSKAPIKRGPSVSREGPVVQDIGELLSVHPRVVFAVRQNSGSLMVDDRPVWMYRILRRPEDVTITDFTGFLQFGVPFAIEAKAPGFRGPRTERELKQAAYIRMIKELGGVGGFADCVEQAEELLR